MFGEPFFISFFFSSIFLVLFFFYSTQESTHNFNSNQNKSQTPSYSNMAVAKNNVFSLVLLSMDSVGPTNPDDPKSYLPKPALVMCCGECGKCSTHDNFAFDLPRLADEVKAMDFTDEILSGRHGAVIPLDWANGVLCPKCTGAHMNTHYGRGQIDTGGCRRIRELWEDPEGRPLTVANYIAHKFMDQAAKSAGFPTYPEYLRAQSDAQVRAFHAQELTALPSAHETDEPSPKSRRLC
jgi:hypothetical protein